MPSGLPLPDDAREERPFTTQAKPSCLLRFEGRRTPPLACPPSRGFRPGPSTYVTVRPSIMRHKRRRDGHAVIKQRSDVRPIQRLGCGTFVNLNKP
jgi:hypothetical protein